MFKRKPKSEEPRIKITTYWHTVRTIVRYYAHTAEHEYLLYVTRDAPTEHPRVVADKIGLQSNIYCIAETGEVIKSCDIIKLSADTDLVPAVDCSSATVPHKDVEDIIALYIERNGEERVTVDRTVPGSITITIGPA